MDNILFSKVQQILVMPISRLQLRVDQLEDKVKPYIHIGGNTGVISSLFRIVMRAATNHRTTINLNERKQHRQMPNSFGSWESRDFMP